MARSLRIEYEGALYHVTARGNERRKIFFTPTDDEKFLEYLTEAKKKYGILIHCYVLMTNHYHLIIETPEANLSKAMHYINGSYTSYINSKRKRSGHLFQGRYKAIQVAMDNYLLELSRYIHLNPVRAGMIQRPEDYIYSSYKAYTSRKREGLLTDDLILGMMPSHKGKGKKAYRSFVEAGIGRELENPLEEVYGGIILGGTRFIKETLQRIKIEYLQKEGISERRALRSTHDIEEIMEVILSYFETDKNEMITNKYSEHRKIAIYFMKERAGAHNSQIGELFERTSNSIAKSYERFRKELKKNRKLSKEIKRIEKALSFVKP